LVNGLWNAGEVNSGSLCVSVAGLEIEINANQAGLTLAVPPSYQKFLKALAERQPGGKETDKDLRPDVNDKLFLQVCTKAPAAETMRWEALIKTINWQLWMDDERRYIFIAPRLLPQRSISVDVSFTSGVVTGAFCNDATIPIYPIEGLDMHLVSNWLANSGDIILHAAGISVDGQGYCFAGVSGSGKSTLANQLAALESVEILGEDQVILRWQDGQFWIFGTPWHENPELCSPLGVPLAKLFFLERDGKQRTLPLTPLDGTARMLQNAFIPFYRTDALPAILDRISALSETVPFFILDYQINTDVWDLIEMAGNK